MSSTRTPARRHFSVAVLLVSIVLAVTVSACGNSSSSTAGSTSSTSGGSGVSTDASSCASAGTRHLTKARVLGDLAISAGAFHRYIYKPLKSGSFAQAGTLHKGLIIAKAAAAALVIKHFFGNAVDNARADPTLCKYVPTMNQIESGLGTLGSQLKSGNVSGLDTSNNLFSRLQQQTGFTPNENASLPSG